jgi:uncharacterized membrane protein YphA (DoxX/SURF4 family)
MTPLTVFLAKLIGLYCIIVSLAMMSRKQASVTAVESLIANPPLVLLVEVLGLACGLAMIIGHNIWSGSALAVVITLIGWATAIRGAVLLALSPEAKAKFFRSLQYEKRFYVYMGLTLILGLYLTVAAFRA